MSTCTWSIKAADVFAQRATSYEIFLFQTIFPMFKHITTHHYSFLRMNSTWRMTSGLLCSHSLWYLQTGKWKLYNRVYMDVFGRVWFSSWKNLLQKTIGQKLVLLQKWRSWKKLFTVFHMEQQFSYLFSYQSHQ